MLAKKSLEFFWLSSVFQLLHITGGRIRRFSEDNVIRHKESCHEEEVKYYIEVLKLGMIDLSTIQSNTFPVKECFDYINCHFLHQ